MYPRPPFSTFILSLLFFGLTTSLCLAEEPPAASPAVARETKQDQNTPIFKSVEERRLYTVLQNERDNLEEDKKVLVLKEKELKTLQIEADKKLKLLDEKLAELQQIQQNIEKLLAKKDAAEIQKTKELSLIYAKMSPDRAALAMATVDEQLASDLLANMKVKSAAKILDKMDKVKASQLSTTFTTIKVE